MSLIDLLIETCDYTYYLLFRTGIGPYKDYLLVVMSVDYFFMMIIAVIVMVFFNKSMRQPDNYASNFILVISTLLLHNAVCLVFGGVFYSAQDWESQMNNVCNVSTIIGVSLRILVPNLEHFVIRSCGSNVSFNSVIRELDPLVDLMFNLFFIACLISFLITWFYGFTEVHN